MVTAFIPVYIPVGHLFLCMRVSLVCVCTFSIGIFLMCALTQSKIDSSKQRHLLQHGWCVVDGALGADMASELLSEMQVLEKAKLFSPNKVRFTVQQSDGQPVLTTPNPNP